MEKKPSIKKGTAKKHNFFCHSKAIAAGSFKPKGSVTCLELVLTGVFPFLNYVLLMRMTNEYTSGSFSPEGLG